MSDTSSRHAIVLADSEGVIRHWSDGAQLHFGYAAHEAEGVPVDLIVPPEYQQQHWDGFRRAMSTGVSKLDGKVLDVPVRIKDGTIVPFQVRFVFLRDAGDRPVGAMVIFLPSSEVSPP